MFASDNPTVLVSWAMLWPWGHIAHSYTLTAYRQKGLATVVQSDLCEKVLASGDIMGTFTEPSNEPNVHLKTKLGFIEVCRCKPLVHMASRLDF